MIKLINGPFGIAELDINQEGKRTSSIKTDFGFCSREIIKTALATKDPLKMIPYLERIEQSSHNHYSTCFCMLLENICNIVPEDTVNRVRTFLLELERIYSHSIYLNKMFSYTENQILINHTTTIRDIILDCSEEITGHRMYGTCSVIGDVNFNISSGNIKVIKRISDELTAVLNKIKRLAKDNPSLLSLFREQVIITEKMIKQNYITGPFSWYDNSNSDLREKEPYLAYRQPEIKILLEKTINLENCTYGRILRLIEDSDVSIKIIKSLFSTGDNIIYNRKQPLKYSAVKPKGEYSQSIESPRGVIKITTEIGKTGLIDSLEIKTPSEVNMSIIDRAIKGSAVDYIEQAFDSLYLSSM